ncbi:DoxX family protein [Arenicellales bacterium IMCC55707]
MTKMKMANRFLTRVVILIETISVELIPVLARLLFGVTLFAFFWKSALTKLGDGLTGFWSPSAGAYAQIFPLKFESVSYDTSAMSFFDWSVVFMGTYAEFVLPLLIVIGLLTRLSAVGMIIFIIVMSFVDVTGHGVELGSLLDGNPSSLIPDQRLFWIFPLIVVLFQGPGRFSLDHLCLANQEKEETR